MTSTAERDRIFEAARKEMQGAGMSSCYVSRATILWCVFNEVSGRDLGEAIATHQRWTGPPVGCTYAELGERIYQRLERRTNDG